MISKKLSWIFLLFLIFSSSCERENLIIPKPRLYPKVNFPSKEYQDFQKDYCSFGFRFPNYAEIKKDDYFFEDKPYHPCWFDIEIPSLNGKLHCSYYPVGKRKDLDNLVNDAYKLAGKHNVKAEYYEEQVIRLPNKVNGVLFEIEGDVATPLQFFLSDSTNHFFRASLYFNDKVNSDSIAPIYDFVKADIDTLIHSFYWK